jgi:hypothetical protein
LKELNEVEMLNPDNFQDPLMVLKRPHLRGFLIRIFYYAKIWCAFKRLDVVRDFEVDKEEFTSGFPQFSSDMALDDDVTPEE